MRVLVTGGTGTVGSRVVRELLARGVAPRVLVRSEERTAGLPGGAEPALGDLERPETLAAAFAGCEAVFLLNALAQDEAEQGLAGVEAARAAGARRVVYLSVPLPAGSEAIPHFATKIRVEQALRDSGLDHLVLRPNNFFQNDLWFRQAILEHGIYPQPLGAVGLHRVDVRDIAAVAVRALLDPLEERGECAVAGPVGLTGEQTAAAWSRALGRDVRYAGDDLDAWASAARTMLPEWLVHDLRIMYAFFQQHGLGATDEELRRQQDYLQRPPRSFETFVAETADAWRRPA
jgi:uncharacterized protein YbjT (DUF2867 family)